MKNLLITGADHEERMKYATSLSMDLLCQQGKVACGQCHNCERVQKGVHPNVILIEPLGTTSEDAIKETDRQGDIKIEQVRRIIEESFKANCEEGRAIFVITHMHQITKAAANALLKSIEESSSKKVFLALSPSRASVLPTIASRLVVLQIKPAPLPTTLSLEMVNDILAITATLPEERFAIAKRFPKERQELLLKLGEFEEVCHALARIFYDKQKIPHPSLGPLVALGISQALKNAMDFLHKNANPLLVIENMLFHHWPYA